MRIWLKKPLAPILTTLLAGAFWGGLAMADVRVPAVAGRFYPDDPVKLKRAIGFHLAAALPPKGGTPIALIAPHAGYVFSGQICADAYNQAAGHDFDLVVLLGTNHTVSGFTGVSIYPEGGYRTPLGIAQIDGEVASALIDADESFTFREEVHRREHSIEVHVPFVQSLFPGAKIVAAIVGAPDLSLCRRFGLALARVLAGKKALIVASSDLSHYPDYADANRTDGATLETILKMDPVLVATTLGNHLKAGTPNLSTAACGAGPILSAMIAAKALGADCARLISYANSGDTLVGQTSRVVGYGAVSFAADPACRTQPQARPHRLLNPGPPTPEQGKTLLAFARATLEQVLTADTLPLVRGFEPSLEQPCGAFVTLKSGGRLRGCIGHMADDTPLCRVIGTMALQAAFNDRRFSPLSLGELNDIVIEISVLTPFSPIDRPEEIRIGRDGVLIRKDGRSAVYLPQVAVEQSWARDEMLDHLCRKAVLPSGCWKNGARLYTFQATIFSESGHASHP